MLQYVAACSSVLQCDATTCSVVQCILGGVALNVECGAMCCSVLLCVAVCCNVLQRVAVCCSVLQCVAFAKETYERDDIHSTDISSVDSSTNDSSRGRV